MRPCECPRAPGVNRRGGMSDAYCLRLDEVPNKQRDYLRSAEGDLAAEKRMEFPLPPSLTEQTTESMSA